MGGVDVPARRFHVPGLVVEEDVRPEALLKALGVPANDPRLKFVKGKGCTHCKNTGYLGRTALHELVAVNENLRNLISKGAPESEIQREATKNGFHPLTHDGIKKALLGITTSEEIARVCLEP